MVQHLLLLTVEVHTTKIHTIAVEIVVVVVGEVIVQLQTQVAHLVVGVEVVAGAAAVARHLTALVEVGPVVVAVAEVVLLVEVVAVEEEIDLFKKMICLKASLPDWEARFLFHRLAFCEN